LINIDKLRLINKKTEIFFSVFVLNCSAF